MKLYECLKCGDYYYKKVKQCPFCDSTVLIEIEGTEENVLFSVLLEINTESEEYEQFHYDSIVEKVQEKLGKDEYNKYGCLSLDNALKTACNKGYFTEMTFYISST